MSEQKPSLPSIPPMPLPQDKNTRGIPLSQGGGGMPKPSSSNVKVGFDSIDGK